VDHRSGISTDVHEDAPQPEFAWRAHPAREHVGRAALGSTVIVALAAFTALFMQSLAWGVFAAAILILALNRFFLPSRFAIDAEGITARYPLRRRRLRWSELRRFACDDHGGYLSTRARRSWLDAYRGLHVLFGEHRDAVSARIRAHLREGGGSWAH
jgi:hypothetical protein